MIPRTISKIFFLILSATFIYSQNITSVGITGASAFSEEDYSDWSGIAAGIKIFTGLKDSVSLNISKQLTNLGYFNNEVAVSIRNPDSSSAEIEIKITEGKPARINKINPVCGDSSFCSSISPYFDDLDEKNYNTYAIENAISSALDFSEENGFPFVSAKISSVYIFNDSLDNPLADVSVNFQTGDTCRINKIEIDGNEKTKSYVIIRQTRIEKDELYRQSKIDNIPVLLNKLAFFQSVQAPQFYFNSKREGILKITLKEKSTNTFDGIIGYTPGDEEEKGYFTGFVNINLRNLFGTGRAFGIKWEQIDRSSQNLELHYLEPWVLNLPLNLQFGLTQRKQDSTYVKRKISGQAEYLATENFSASLLFSTGETIPTVLNQQRFTVYKSDNIETGVNLKYDTRDDILSPREGFLFQNTYTYSRKRITGPEEYIKDLDEKNIKLQRIELDIFYFLQLFRNQVIALKLQGRELSGSSFEISDLYLLGGTNSLRGYREDQFAGNRIIWENLEYRLLLGGKSYAFTFFDAGYYLRNADEKSGITKNESVKTGYGAGINVETGLGVISVSYALGEGDSFSNGKIHFGLVNEF